MEHRFVEYIPSEIDDNVLYISIEYDVAKHKCPCGCGVEIVTSLSPARWQLTYDGETVSLSPSIGNWSHPCKSHYFITKNKVVWAGAISDNAISKVVKKDQETLKKHINNRKDKGIFKLLKRLFGISG